MKKYRAFALACALATYAQSSSLAQSYSPSYDYGYGMQTSQVVSPPMWQVPRAPQPFVQPMPVAQYPTQYIQYQQPVVQCQQPAVRYQQPVAQYQQPVVIPGQTSTAAPDTIILPQATDAPLPAPRPKAGAARAIVQPVSRPELLAVANDPPTGKVIARTEVTDAHAAPAADEHACIDVAHNGCDDCFWHHRCEVYAEFLYLNARGADVHFGEPVQGCGAAAVPMGRQGDLESDYSPGVRLGLGVALSDCSSIEASYTYWENDAHDSVAASGNALIFPSLAIPSTVAACGSNVQQAIAGDGMQFQFGDLVYKHLLCGNCSCYAINWFAGARYAHLREDLLVDYVTPGDTFVNTRIDFDGAGPRIGLEGELTCGAGFLLYGRGSANIVIGHFGASYLQTNTFAGTQGETTYQDDRVVPILDLELGVGWTSPKGCFRAMVGYSVSAWFNALTTTDLINAVQTNEFNNHGDNLSNTLWFDGLTARVEYRF
jgi:hypothetical protein